MGNRFIQGLTFSELLSECRYFYQLVAGEGCSLPVLALLTSLHHTASSSPRRSDGTVSRNIQWSFILYIEQNHQDLHSKQVDLNIHDHRHAVQCMDGM